MWTESRAMLFESRHITVTADHGTATLAFGFGGEPANALDLESLRELDDAIRAVSLTPSLAALVLRSSIPDAFCSGLRPSALASLTHPADRAAFAWYGQQVLERLACLDAVSIALIDGPCLGAGLELALACDHRLSIARPATHFRLPRSIRLFRRHVPPPSSDRSKGIATPRVRPNALWSRMCSARSSGYGLLRTALKDRTSDLSGPDRSTADQAASKPVPGSSGGRTSRVCRASSRWSKDPLSRHQTINPIQPFPDTVGLLGNDSIVDRLAAEVALRGGSIAVCGDRSGVFAGIATATARGFVTPLEAEQAWQRVRASDTLEGFDRAGLVFVVNGQRPFRVAAALSPRTIVCVVRADGSGSLDAAREFAMPFPFPRRLLRIGFSETKRLAIFPTQLLMWTRFPQLAAWMKPFGFSSVVFPLNRACCRGRRDHYDSGMSKSTKRRQRASARAKSTSACSRFIQRRSPR